jgi:putative tricarboxylic transport membrane protein
MQIFMESIAAIFTLQNMLFMFVAIVFGMMAGALPGFTATMAVALMVPFTFTMSPVSGLSP